MDGKVIQARQMFPFTEMLEFLQSAPPQLVCASLRPLVGFRKLEDCSCAELKEMLVAAVTLEAPSSTMACDEDHLHSYADAAVELIRAQIPHRQAVVPSRIDQTGAGFWHKRPMRWKLPWITMKMMAWEHAAMLRLARRRGMWIAHGEGDYPIYVKGQLSSSHEHESTQARTAPRECPIVVFHGATCKFVDIWNNLMCTVPEHITTIAPLFTSLW